MRFLHCADLHLSRSEEGYSLGVLEEIVDLARRQKCGALFFAGDLFDSRGDAEALREPFRKSLEGLVEKCAVYFLPGNHEELGTPAGRDGSLARFDFGGVKLLAGLPYSLEILSPEAELLALPYRRDFSDYRDWGVPEKKKPLRILLSHGTVPGIVYTGPGEDSAEGVIDPDLFAFLKVDYAALGHIHGGSLTRLGETLVAYPGSARIWREGETGPRHALLGTTDSIPPRVEEIPLRRAGAFRSLSVVVDFDGNPRLPEDALRGAEKADWIRLDVSGVVEEEGSALESVRKLKGELEKTFRRVTTDTRGLEVLAGISTHPLALRFVERWEELSARPEAADKAEVYRLARRRGLLALKGILESRK